MLVLLNVPLIGIWVKLLTIPYKYLYPSAMFFVCIGVYAANNDMFQVGEVLVIGILGYILLRLGFHPAPILLGFVPRPACSRRTSARAMLISRGDILVFAGARSAPRCSSRLSNLIGGQLYFRLKSGGKKASEGPDVEQPLAAE